MLSVSVVVPVRNAARTLPYCLTALASLEPAPLEILLVDNGSTDGSLSLLREFSLKKRLADVRVLEEPRRGAAAARNNGIRVARGEIVAFTDADCAPEPGWLLHLTRPLDEPAVGAAAGRVIARRAESTLELFSALYTLQLPDKPARHERWTPREGGYPTANFAVRSALARSLGGFDETVEIYGEDYDFCARLYALGTKIAYAPEAVVSHHHRVSLAPMMRQAFGFGRGHPYVFRRHAGRGLWMDLPGWPLLWNGSPVRGWLDFASADKKILALLLLGLAYRPLLLFLPLYGLALATSAARRARRAGVPVSPAVAFELATLLVLKSMAMTAGRWWGSLKYGALCL